MTAVVGVCLGGVALCIALVALVAALDAREFWKSLLDDYREHERIRERLSPTHAIFQRERSHTVGPRQG